MKSTNENIFRGKYLFSFGSGDRFNVDIFEAKEDRMNHLTEISANSSSYTITKKMKDELIHHYPHFPLTHLFIVSDTYYPLFLLAGDFYLYPRQNTIYNRKNLNINGEMIDISDKKYDLHRDKWMEMLLSYNDELIDLANTMINEILGK